MEETSVYIKLHVPRESFWGTKLSENTAKVDNILLNTEIGFGDIVKFNPENNEVISVIVKKSNTFAINYSVEKGNVKETYNKIYNHFEERGFPIEGMVSGLVLVSVPVGLPESSIRKAIEECPVPVTLNEENNEETY